MMELYIFDYIKQNDNMKYLKRFSVNESGVDKIWLTAMVHKYGKDNLMECDSVMLDIKDLSYDLKDLGFEIKIDYSDSTRYVQDRIPKIEVYIIGEDELFDHNYTDGVFPVIEDIKRYVTGLGFSTNGHFTDGYPGWSGGWSPYRAYKLLIQK
jgi:hypothetical protein